MVSCLVSCGGRFGLSIVTGREIMSMGDGTRMFRMLARSNRAFRTQAVVGTANSFGGPFVPFVGKRRAFRKHVVRSSSCEGPSPFVGREILIIKDEGSTIRVTVRLTRMDGAALTMQGPIRLVEREFLKRSLRF